MSEKYPGAARGWGLRSRLGEGARGRVRAEGLGLHFRPYGQTYGRGPQNPFTMISASLSIWVFYSSILGIRPHKSQDNPVLQQLPGKSAGS